MLTLYEFGISPFGQKVKIALREKGVPFERRNAFENRDALRGANRRAELPLLVDGEVEVSESTIILDYIDEKWPEPPLMPADPAARAEARHVEELCDTQLEALIFGLAEMRFFPVGEEAAEKAIAAYAAQDIKRIYADLEEALGDRDYFGGDSIGRADCAAFPHLNTARSMKIAPPSERLEAWLQRMKTRDSVAETVKEARESVAAFQAMVGEAQKGAARRQFRDHRLDWFVRAGGWPILSKRIEAGNVRFAVE